ncbi:hypothetical protein EDC17_101829 [Sphingobacterium alimentarium]|uniref:Lipoprotein n=1 Tax=Sphingobacterium alimentarium TaxID=797292 RepID=A0A4R3VY86_9SPHI|nr:hypothetical protein [Sphingobacterium alimentarium]TCV14012.1 hypothetical protein EDC17_101829 [Sphingobacterium alimentarium]
MKAIKSLLATGVIATTLLASCGNSTDSQKSTEPTLATFTNNKEADRQQLFLRIVDEAKTDSSVVYVAKSVFEQDTVGLQVEVLNGIKPGVNGQGQPIQEGFVEGAIKLSSIGAESDALVKALASIFKTSSAGTMSSSVILPTVFSSNTVEVDLDKKSTYSFKLFLPNTVGEPAEVFATLDLYKRSFEIGEKDVSYRAQIISAFEGK